MAGARPPELGRKRADGKGAAGDSLYSLLVFRATVSGVIQHTNLALRERNGETIVTHGFIDNEQ